MHGNGRQEADGGRARVRTLPVIGRPPWLLALLLIVAGVLINVLTPTNVFVGAAFAAAPLVTAALWTFRGTVATAVVSMATLTGVLWSWSRLPWLEAVLRLSTVGTVSALAVLVSRVLSHSEVRLASVRQVAEAVQLAVLPVPPGRIGELSIAVRYEAAQADTRIGGDLYAVQRTPYGLRLMVGDVRGKGLDAVSTVTVVLGAFREAAEAEPDLASVADRIEHALLRERGQYDDGAGRSEGFVTAVLAEVPAGEPERLLIVNRGHPPPVLLSAEGVVRLLEPDGEAYALPLGLGNLGGPADGAGRTGPVPFPPGALLLLHTDGLTEARNAAGAFYDLAERLRGRRFAGPEALLDALLADIEAHTGGHREDDLALLAVMRDLR